MNAQTVALLQEIVRRESLSLLTYIGEAFPWTPSRGTETLARLKQIVKAHNDAVTALGRYLIKLREPLVYLGSYPNYFTTLNFLSLDHILPKLIESERQGLLALEHDLAKISDSDAHAHVENLYAVKKRTLAELVTLATSYKKLAPIAAPS